MGLKCGKKKQRTENRFDFSLKEEEDEVWQPWSTSGFFFSLTLSLSLSLSITFIKLEESDIRDQTRQALAKVDVLLAQVGSGRSRILEARIWVKDMGQHFAAMNEVWNAWVDPEDKGARYCVEANMARPTILVEVQVVAAI